MSTRASLCTGEFDYNKYYTGRARGCDYIGEH